MDVRGLPPAPPAPEEEDLPDEVTPDEDAKSPQFVSEVEALWYAKIHGMRKHFYRQLKAAWNDFKKKYVETLTKSVSAEQENLFDELLKDFHNIADEGFQRGVYVGNAYFEDTFKVGGLSTKQQRQVANKYLNVFDDKAENLYKKDPMTELKRTPLQDTMHVLDSFDRYILLYASIAASVAYSVFTRNIQMLNTLANRVYSLAGLDVPPGTVRVQWVLEEDAAHSEDCWKMAQGKDGDGVWDAEELAAMEIFPQSPNLDCGGNCKCHLRPLVSTGHGPDWADRIIELPRGKNILILQPNLTIDEMLALLEEKRVMLPDILKRWISETPYFRRSEWWKGLHIHDGKPPLVSIIQTAEEFRVEGATGRLISTNLPGRILLKIYLPESLTLETLTLEQQNMILRTLAHELGHTLMNTRGGKDLVGLFGDDIAAALLKQITKSRSITISQVERNFEKVVLNIPKASLTPEVVNDIKMMKVFLQDADTFMNLLFKAVEEGKTFAGVDARVAWKEFERVIRQYSSETMLTRGYQLWNVDEYFAEWFSLLLTDPVKAALFDPALNRLMAKEFPAIFQAAKGVVKVVLPEAVSVFNRIDLPLPTSYAPLTPSWTSYTKNLAGFRSITDKVAFSTLDKQLKEVIRTYPAFLQNKFFDGLKVQFADKVQVGGRAGSRSYLGYYDTKTGVFVVNYDRWRTLTLEQRGNMLADMVSRNILETGPAFVKQEVESRYRTYLAASLDWLDRKEAILNISNENLTDIIFKIFGNPEQGIPGDLNFWVRNFEQYIKPVLSKISDFPILNVESLASPDAYFREWMRLYLTKPAAAEVYPGFNELIRKFL